jgi:hypothetical protein
MPGQFFQGNVRDRGLENAKFIEIARALAVGLQKSSYLPAKKLEDADLLLIVHWGVTIGTEIDREQKRRDLEERNKHMADYALAVQNETAFAEQAKTSNSPDMSMGYEPAISTSVRAAKSTIDFDFVNASSRQVERDTNGQSTAALLGFSADLRQDENSPMASQKTATLMTLLEADRYFVVVIAYDFRRYLAEKKLVRLWTSRLSIRSAGVNFPMALQRLSQIGGQGFGTADTELKFVQTKKLREVVTAGEIKIIGFEPERDEPKK